MGEEHKDGVLRLALARSVARERLRREGAVHGYRRVEEHHRSLPIAVGDEASAWIVGDGPWGAPCDAVCTLREAGVRSPIVAIVCTVVDLVRAMRAGASDCVKVPIDVEELFARLAVLPRFAPVQLDEATLEFGSRRVTFRRAERDILRYLMAQHPRTVSKEELLTEVLGTNGDGGSVRTHLWHIRRRLRRSGLPDLVTTVRGVGYRAHGAMVIER